jgi:hypothetical protein
MILNYLLSLSILIMSVIKVTDLFLHTNRALDTKRSEFIQLTKKTHQDGSVSLMGALLTVMISALLMFFAYKFKIELKEAQYRKESYLCFHELNITTENYIFDMTALNWSLRTSYAFVVTGVGEVAHEALILARNARHFYYIKDLAMAKNCNGKTAAVHYLMNLPYKTSGVVLLKTNPDGTTIIRENKWTVTYYKPPIGIRTQKSFCLKADMEIEGSFLPNFKVKTSEISMGGFSKLKCLSGFL